MVAVFTIGPTFVIDNVLFVIEKVKEPAPYKPTKLIIFIFINLLNQR